MLPTVQSLTKINVQRTAVENKPLDLIRNTLKEEAAIAAGIAADPDTFVPSDEQFVWMKPRGVRPEFEQLKVPIAIGDGVERHTKR